MTAKQAINAYEHINGAKYSESKKLTLRERFRNYMKNNAYYFISASAAMSGYPLVYTNQLILKGLNA